MAKMLLRGWWMDVTCSRDGSLHWGSTDGTAVLHRMSTRRGGWMLLAAGTQQVCDCQPDALMMQQGDVEQPAGSWRPAEAAAGEPQHGELHSTGVTAANFQPSSLFAVRCLAGVPQLLTTVWPSEARSFSVCMTCSAWKESSPLEGSSAGRKWQKLKRRCCQQQAASCSQPQQHSHSKSSSSLPAAASSHRTPTSSSLAPASRSSSRPPGAG